MSVINIWSFNNDELFNLVKAGRKTATCWLYDGGRIADHVGDIEHIVNSHGETIAIKITNISVRKFADIDDSWARQEGEGDRSLTYWRRVHRDFFYRHCNTIVTPNTKLVCMEFKIV